MKRALFLSVGLLVSVALVVEGWLINAHEALRTPESDESILAYFQAHKPEFHGLLKASLAEGARHNTFDIDCRTGAEEAAMKPDVRTLCALLRRNVTILNDGGYSVRFILSRQGEGIFGERWIKGIEYMPKPSLPRDGALLGSLNAAPKLRPGVYYREIEPEWYVFYYNEDD
jgi:hypothetical protein